MKDLREYMLSKFDIHNKFMYESFVNEIENYFGEIPNNIVESIHNGDMHDYILENLNTHDTELLQKKILGIFNKYDVKFYNYSNDNKNAFEIQTENAIELSNDNNFIRLLDFFGYYVSKTYKDACLVCPKYSKNMNDLVYNKNYGKLYHFTTKDHDNSILKNGLKTRNKKYRFFPERIYLYSSFKPLNKINGIKEYITKVVGQMRINIYGLSVFKIDLSNLNNEISFYKDDIMNDENSVFTYTNIPKECIEKIEFEY